MRRHTFAAISALIGVCLSAQTAGADGFGQYATGGAGGSTVTVTTAEAFRTYAETVNTPYIIQVQGTLELAGADSGRVRIQSNKTIRGIGEKPTIIGSLQFKNDCSNVIIERLNITCPENYTSEEDGISIKERITNVVVTKCTIYDSWDGLLDVARKSDWVTVSWCRFYYTSHNGNNNRVSLVGNTDSSGDEGTLHVTFHHNWFGTLCMQRIPSLRYGRGHIYNNYYNCPGNIYCIWSRIQAECLVENNYFKDVQDPYVNNRDGAPVSEWGRIAASGNILDNCTGTVHAGTDSVFAPPYAYTLDEAARVPAIVQWGSGADGKDGEPPHWVGGMYGDFDGSGFVDGIDFGQFARYWRAASGVENADFDENGVVDEYELAMFVENWLYVPPDETAPEAPADFRARGLDGRVVLNWNGNAEEDLAGYNVYRSTVPGSGYVKLNSSLLSAPEYEDTSVINGAMYYYAVQAVDTSGNASDYSTEACASAQIIANVIIQELATGFCGINGIVDQSGEHGGYTGAGYLDTTNATGSGINWRVSVPSAETYVFEWRFANGSATARPARVLVDGNEVVSSVNFAATGAWENWMTVSAEVLLPAGGSTVRLEAVASGGCANIDYLKVMGNAPEAAPCE